MTGKLSRGSTVLLFAFVFVLALNQCFQIDAVAAPPPPYAWTLLVEADDAVNSVEICASKLFIGGSFVQVKATNESYWTPVYGVAVFEESEWQGLYDNNGTGPGMGVNGTGEVNQVMTLECIEEIERLYVGGVFRYAGNEVPYTNSLAAYDLFYRNWESVGVLSDIYLAGGHGCLGLCPPEVRVLDYIGGDQVVIGGRWIKYGAGVLNTSSIAWLNIASSVWTAFGGGITADFQSSAENFEYPPLAKAVAVNPVDQTMLVVGQFDDVTNFDGSTFRANGTAFWQGLPGAYDWDYFSSGLFPCLEDNLGLQYLSIADAAYAAGAWWISGSFCYDRSPVSTQYRAAMVYANQEYVGWQAVLEGQLNSFSSDAQNQAAVFFFTQYIQVNCNGLDDPIDLMQEAASFAMDLTTSLFPLNIFDTVSGAFVIEGADVYVGGVLNPSYGNGSGVMVCRHCAPCPCTSC